MQPYQKYCGQTQPHNAHVWNDFQSNAIGLYAACAGTTGPGTCRNGHPAGTCLCHVTASESPPFEFTDGREPECVEAWPECEMGKYDPRCCRFPKSCSCGSIEETNKEVLYICTGCGYTGATPDHDPNCKLAGSGL